MGRRFLLLSLFLFAVIPVSMLKAQAAGTGNNAAAFPVTMVLEGADYASFKEGAARIVWRPDWPPRLPPDAFKVLSGEVSRVVVEGDGFSLNLSFGPTGLVEEFPFVLNGRLMEVSVVYGEFSQIKEMFLTFPSWDETDNSDEDPWRLEFLEYRDSLPYLVRGSRLDAWYFIYFFRTVNEIVESWYDVAGNLIGAFAFSVVEIGDERRIGAIRDYLDPDGGSEYYYDSRGFLTESSGPAGLYKVLYYREDFPRYWERRPSGGSGGLYGSEGKFSFQWNEAGFLLRLTGESENAPLDHRYDYTVDERGNWIERKETQIVSQTGLLFPSPGDTYNRVLEYRK